MAIYVCVTILVILTIGYIVGAPSEGTCEGGYREGQYVNEDRQWSECKDGRLIAKGCLTQNGDRVKFDETYDFYTVKMQCVISDHGKASLVNKSCIQDGRERQPGQVWDDNRYVYTCKKDGTNVSLQAIGCLRNGAKLLIGEKTFNGDVVYECKKGNSVPVMVPWGCQIDGKQYAINEEFNSNEFWYTCKSKDGTASLEMSGCVNENTRYRDGDTFFKNDLVFKCMVQNENAATKVIGCLQKDPKTGLNVDRRVGCTWDEGEGPFRVVMTCLAIDETKSAKPVPLHCNYKMPEHATYMIAIGCYRIFDKIGVGCLKEENSGKVKAMQLQLDEKYKAIDKPDGLKFC